MWRFGLLCRAAVQGRAVSGGGVRSDGGAELALGAAARLQWLVPPSDTQRGLSPLRFAAAWAWQKNLGRTSRPFLLFDSGSSIRISRVVEVLALAFNYGLAKPIADVY